MPCEEHRPLPGAAGAGATVYLERGTNPARRTAWDLIAVEKGHRLINMDAQAPNRIFAQWIRQQEPEITVHPEYRYGTPGWTSVWSSRRGCTWVEVKGVTLEREGHCLFPDAPTERGVRHLHELIRAVDEGHRATAFFVIQMADVLDFAPNDATHPAFGAALREAARRGVEIAAYTCRVTPETVTMDAPVPVQL